VPAHFEVTKRNGVIEFTWDAPSPGNFSLKGYHIYLVGNDNPINTSLITGTSYQHNFAGQEPYYVFHLAAQYGEGESDPVSAILLNSGDSFLSDSLALVILYNQCGGPGWMYTYNWLEGPLDTWHGVTVENKRVTALNLSGSWHERFGLNSTIPEELGVLSALRNLNLSYNALEGEIPQALYSLQELRELNLTDNLLTGELSVNLERLVNLESLLLANNLLYGEVPSDISFPENLQRVNLSGNSLTGTILPQVSSLTLLQYLELGNNQFTGMVPPETGALKDLVELNLSGNRFSGELPDELEKLTEMMYLVLDNNQFHGAVPPGVANIPRLREISLVDNDFDAFPALTYTANLAILAMDGNRFTFEDIEPNVDIEFARGYMGLTYQDQEKIGKEETRYVPPGKPFTLSVYCGGKNNLYQWFRDGDAVSDVSPSPEFVVENVVNGNNGAYHCQVTNTRVHGLTIESHPAILVGKDVLVANAGNDFGAVEGTVVTLNGTQSYSPGNTRLSYHWTAPDGIELTGADEARPTFTAPRVDHDMQYIFTLVVSDGNEDSAPDEVVVTIRDAGDVPVANAGHDQTVEELDLVFLDGSGSFAPGEGELTYRWTAPEAIELIGTDKAQPYFTAPEIESDTVFVFILVVTIDREDSEPDEVAVTVKNIRKIPVAHAGSYQAVDEGDTVLLDGSRSHVKGDGELSYQWTAPEGIELTGADEVHPSFTAPDVISDTDFVFTLVVTSNVEVSAPDRVVITVRNLRKAPGANAGPDQTVHEGDQVILDGSGSSAPGGGDLTYRWTAPEGIELTGADEAKPSFTAPEVDPDTVFVFTLVVTSGGEDSKPDEVAVTVQNIQQPPVADAGPDQTVHEGDQVILDGSGSSVPGGGGLTYRWTAPEGIVLTGADEAKPSFTAPEVDSDMVFVFTLVVTSGGEDSAPDEIAVTVQNIPQPPVADAGPDQTVRTGETVTLDGTGSVDPEAGNLSYTWQAPQGITLEGHDEPYSTFTAPLFDTDTTITVYLVVTNPYGTSDTAGVEITIRHSVTVSMNSIQPVHLDMYPNPSNGIVNFRLKNSETGKNIRLTVTTSSGKMILEKQFNDSENFSINLSEQPPGIYFIQLIHGGQLYTRKQIIK
jgi:hypothetical protein